MYGNRCWPAAVSVTDIKRSVSGKQQRCDSKSASNKKLSLLLSRTSHSTE